MSSSLSADPTVRAPRTAWRSPRLAHTLAALGLAAAATGLPWAAVAQTDPGAAPTPPAATPRVSGAADGMQRKLARADREFLEKAAHAGLAEVQASRLAATKATDPAVKSFAQKMVDDHTRVGEELKTVAMAKQYEPPTEPSLVQKAKLKLLETADGAKFDERYTKSMGVEAHEDTVKLFRKASTGARDAGVRAFAAKTLPGLQSHLTMARQLDQSLHARGAGTSRNMPAMPGMAGSAASGATGR